jgi:hypothetical protein
LNWFVFSYEPFIESSFISYRFIASAEIQLKASAPHWLHQTVNAASSCDITDMAGLAVDFEALYCRIWLFGGVSGVSELVFFLESLSVLSTYKHTQLQIARALLMTLAVVRTAANAPEVLFLPSPIPGPRYLLETCHH